MEPPAIEYPCTTSAITLLDKKELFERYLCNTKASLSAFAFANIFAWKDFFEFHFEIIQGHLCLFAKNDLGTFLYLPLLGDTFSLQAVEEAFYRMDKWGSPVGYSRIENVPAGMLRFFSPSRFSFYRRGYEYCYYRQDLEEMKGTPYKSKRALYNQFMRKYPTANYRPYKKEDFASCLELLKKWTKDRYHRHEDENYRTMLEENYRLHETLLGHASEAGLVVRVVTLKGQVIAYTCGYPLNPNVFCVFLEVADFSFRGLPVFVFRQFSMDPALRTHRFINVVDDFEMPHIRFTKLSFRPRLLLAVYTVTRR